MHEMNESCDVVVRMLEKKIDDLVKILHKDTDDLLENLKDIERARREENLQDLEVWAGLTRVLSNNIDRRQELINDCIHGIKVIKFYQAEHITD